MYVMLPAVGHLSSSDRPAGRIVVLGVLLLHRLQSVLRRLGVLLPQRRPNPREMSGVCPQLWRRSVCVLQMISFFYCKLNI